MSEQSIRWQTEAYFGHNNGINNTTDGGGELADFDWRESPSARYRGRRVVRLSASRAASSSAASLSPPSSSSTAAAAAASGATFRRASVADDEHELFDDTTPASRLTAPLDYGKRQRTTESGDRFIPSREEFDVDVANYSLRKAEAFANATLDTSPAKEEYKRLMGEQLFGANAHRTVLTLGGGGGGGGGGRAGGGSSFSDARRGDAASTLLAIPPSARHIGAPLKCQRTIPRAPVHILDAPEMLEDYYLNLLDWSRTNTVGVALNKAVYLWQASTGSITKLFEVDGPDSSISSLRFTAHGDVIAIGTTDADVQLWDLTTLKRVRTLRGHQARVAVVAWHDNTLASGSRDSMIHVHDPRAAAHITQRLSKHTQEVCGLTYSSDGLLASGGNDNLLCVWESGRATPRFAFDHHTAAVKGVSFCPWQSGLLASGGGTADRTLRFWDTSTGACLNSIDTKSQVCSVVWSTHYRELVSSHGYSQNQLCVWKYPTLTKVCELTGHMSRVLHLAISPDGETVVSASGDETLRFWRVWERRSELKSQARRDIPSVVIR